MFVHHIICSQKRGNSGNSPFNKQTSFDTNAIPSGTPGISAAIGMDALVSTEPNRVKFLNAGLADVLMSALKLLASIDDIALSGLKVIFLLADADDDVTSTALGTAGMYMLIIIALFASPYD
jgi:hypothetical protein